MATEEEDDSSFFIKIILMTGKKLNVPIDNPMLSIGALKEKIQNETEIAAEAQNLFYRGKFLKDDKTLIDHGIKSTVVMKCIVRMKTRLVFEQDCLPHDDTVQSCAISSDDQMICSGCYDHHVRLFRARTGEMIHKMTGHSGHVFCVEFTSDNTKIVSGSDDGFILVWDVETGQELERFGNGGRDYRVRCLNISNDDQLMITGGRGPLRLWNFNTKEIIYELAPKSDRQVRGVAISNDSSFAVSGSEANFVTIWDINTGEIKHKLNGHTDGVTCIALSNDDSFIISGSYDKSCIKWNVETGEQLCRFEGHSNWVLGCALSNNNLFLVTCGGEHNLKLWDIENGDCTNTLEGHRGNVRDCTTSRYRDAVLVSACADKTLRLWNLNKN